MSSARFIDVQRIRASAAGWAVDESGVTAIEYGLLAALIAVAAIGAIAATGDSLEALYVYWSQTVAGAL